MFVSFLEPGNIDTIKILILIQAGPNTHDCKLLQVRMFFKLLFGFHGNCLLEAETENKKLHSMINSKPAEIAIEIWVLNF